MSNSFKLTIVWKCSLVLLTFMLGTGGTRADEYVWNNRSNTCENGLHHQPKGPFAAMLFCEDALGNYLGILYFDRMGSRTSPPLSRWSINNRYWQTPEWGSDITSFAWSRDGRLFVATNHVYGDGMLYEIDLLARTTKRLLPREPPIGKVGPGFIINNIDHERGILYITPGGEISIQPKLK